MTTVALDAFPQYSTNGGLPLAGGKLYSYQAGTSTPLATYTDRSGSVANANPVVLDAAGRADIWLSVNVAYKLVLEDSAGNVLDSIDDYYAGADPAQLTAAGIVPSTGGTYTGLVSFTGGATFDGTAAQDLATLDSLGIASVQNANLWTNSEFNNNQRAVATAADAAYGWDRVVLLCDGGSVSISNFDTAGLAVGGNAARITQPDAGPKRVGMLQIVEAKDCISYRGLNLSMSVQLRSSTAQTLRVALVAWTGAKDAPTRDVVNNWASTTYTAGNFFVANTSTIAVVAASLGALSWTTVTVSSTSPGGVVAPASMNNLYMVIWTDQATAQNTTIDVTAVRCGQGTGVQLWTPPNEQQDLARCQRFFEAGNTASTTYNAAGTATVYRIPFAVQKRVAPTVALSSITNSNSSGTVAGTVTVDSFNVAYTMTALGVGSTTAVWSATADL